MGSKFSTFTLRALRSKFAERPAPTQQLLQDALDILLNTDLRQEIANIAQPTLIIHGDKDALAPVQAANWLRQHLPNALLRVIAGASHAPFLSHTDPFVDAIEEFLLEQKVIA